MRNKTLALLLLVAVIPLAGCLQKESSTTIYLRNDGTIEWAVLDQNVRSDEQDTGKRADEERAYIDPILNGTDRLTEGFRALGGTNVRSVVLRDRAPFATLRSADFEHLNQVWERALKSCQIPHRLELKTDGLVTTWTMAVQVEPEPESPNGCDADAVSAVLSDSTDHLRIMLESGKFLSATGFKILSTDSVELEEITGETVKNNNGVLTFSLTWERKAG
jgi:hypothetical protein